MTDRITTIETATAIVSAYLGRNQVAAGDIPQLIRSVYEAVLATGGQQTEPQQLDSPAPAVSVRRSITEDYIICLEDGARLKMLKRYLRTQFGMTPDEYRKKWKLPESYPMVAPSYARMRSDMAKRIGLGTRPGTPRGRRSRSAKP